MTEAGAGMTEMGHRHDGGGRGCDGDGKRGYDGSVNMRQTSALPLSAAEG